VPHAMRDRVLICTVSVNCRLYPRSSSCGLVSNSVFSFVVFLQVVFATIGGPTSLMSFAAVFLVTASCL